MADWLKTAFKPDAEVEWEILLLRLSFAFLLGCLVANIYRWTNGRGREQPSGMVATLILLTLLIAVITFVINDNTARAFSLVGTLAIVRFRTVVEDTRDTATAFMILAVAIGMGVGLGYVKTPLVTLLLATLAAYLFTPNVAEPAKGLLDFTLSVRLGIGRRPEEVLQQCFDRHLAQARLTSMSTARQGAAMDLMYAVQLREEKNILPLVAELNALDGVQSAEIRR